MRDGAALAAAPPVATRHLCGEFALPVPVEATRFLAVSAEDSAGVRDDDQMMFGCIQP